MSERKTNTATFDKTKLLAAIQEKGLTASQLSKEMGLSEKYVINRINDYGCTMPYSNYKLMCMILGIDEKSIAPDPPKAEQKKALSNEAQILVNITTRLKELSEKADMIIAKLSEMDERDEKVYSKVHANTLQIESIKDSVKYIKGELKITDYDKAVRFLRETLSGGRMIGEEVIRKADAAGIKRADLNKAKRDIQVDTSTTGYGKTQKTWWFLAD